MAKVSIAELVLSFNIKVWSHHFVFFFNSRVKYLNTEEHAFIARYSNTAEADTNANVSLSASNFNQMIFSSQLKYLAALASKSSFSQRERERF